jgi:hypothetical protein
MDFAIANLCDALVANGALWINGIANMRGVRAQGIKRISGKVAKAMYIYISVTQSPSPA